jgi:uncharacterized membrane protein
MENWHNKHLENRTIGEYFADTIATFGGSWSFIGLFFLFIFIWVFINSIWLVTKPFDPYPFILLNLGLSLLAAIQAPIIMMSQRRQEARDRAQAEEDYKTNLEAKKEIESLQLSLTRIELEKLDDIHHRIKNLEIKMQHHEYQHQIKSEHQ